MKMKRTSFNILLCAIIGVSFLIGGYFYPKMPELMASHWNIQGTVDGYMPRALGVFLLPVILIVMFIVFQIIPVIDPLRENITKFRSAYNHFILLIFLFMLYIYLASLAANLGMQFHMTIAITPALAILFYNAGVLMEHAKRNWFIGFRTPWTLASDRVWNKTHEQAATLFKASGLLSLFTLIFPEFALYIVLGPVLVSSLFLTVYSYSLISNRNNVAQ